MTKNTARPIKLPKYPTKRQISFVAAICATLRIGKPKSYSTGAYGQFIRRHSSDFYRARYLTRIGILGGEQKC